MQRYEGTNNSDTDKQRTAKHRLGIVTSTSSRHYSVAGLASISVETRQRRRKAQGLYSTEFEANHTSRRYRLWVPLISRSIEISNTRLGYCSPSFGLNFPHVMSYSTYFSKVRPVLKSRGLEGFQELMSRGICSMETEFSIETVNPVAPPGFTISIAEASCWKTCF